MVTFQRGAVSILLSLLIAAKLCVAAQAQQIQSIEIKDVGIYDVEKRGTVDAPGVPIAHHRNISGATKSFAERILFQQRSARTLVFAIQLSATQ